MDLKKISPKSISNINKLNDIPKYQKKIGKARRTEKILKSQSEYLKAATKGEKPFINKNGKIISIDEMSRDPQYKEKMAEFYSKNPNAGQRETKNELLKISKANIQQSQSIESKNKLDLEKLTSSLNESHERRGQEKLTKIELESKEKIKKNQDKLERTLDDLTYNDETN